MSYAELLKLQGQVEAAIAERRVSDAHETKEQLRQMAEKAGFDIKELYGRRGSPRGLRRCQIPQPEGRLADVDRSRSQAQLAGGCRQEGCEDRLFCDLTFANRS